MQVFQAMIVYSYRYVKPTTSNLVVDINKVLEFLNTLENKSRYLRLHFLRSLIEGHRLCLSAYVAGSAVPVEGFFLSVRMRRLLHKGICDTRLRPILGSLLKNLVTSTLPLLFETVVTVTLNWEKVTRYRQKVSSYFPLLFVTSGCICAPMFSTRF